MPAPVPGIFCLCNPTQTTNLVLPGTVLKEQKFSVWFNSFSGFFFTFNILPIQFLLNGHIL